MRASNVVTVNQQMQMFKGPVKKKKKKEERKKERGKKENNKCEKEILHAPSYAR